MNTSLQRLINSFVFFSLAAVTYSFYEWILFTPDVLYSIPAYLFFLICYCLGVVNLVAFCAGSISSYFGSKS